MARRGFGRFLLGRFQHPAQVVVTVFGLAVLVGTVLLAMPPAVASGRPVRLLDALFTATSAVCVTGLTIVDTAAHWSVFGQAVILVLIQLGGFGIMTLATLFALLISGRTELVAGVPTRIRPTALEPADLRRVVRRVLLFSLGVEAVTAAILALRFALGYGEPVGRALYLGVFHAVSAFNNAGFTPWPDDLLRFVTDAWVCLPLAGAVIVGGLGFPVVFELVRTWRRPGRWSVLTRLTLGVSLVLLGGGTVMITLTEWANPDTLGPLEGAEKWLAGFFTGVTPRTAGFTTLDVSQMHTSTWLVIEVLMFIGGGSAGTAGGIKVTTVGVLVYLVWAELRGETRVNVGRRRLTESVQRQALSIAVLGITLIAVSTYVLLLMTPHNLSRVLFEVVSALGTVGLSTGITADLPAPGTVLVALLMFIGRVGPLTLFSALALRDRVRHYELPEERMIVG